MLLCKSVTRAVSTAWRLGFFETAIDVAVNGMPLRAFVVPSIGSVVTMCCGFLPISFMPASSLMSVKAMLWCFIVSMSVFSAMKSMW